MKRYFCVVASLLSLALLLGAHSCGRQAPTYTSASLTVTSDPSGASIWINGADTGFLTPSTVDDLDEGRYEVAVLLAGSTSVPDSWTVDLNWGESKNIEFSLFEDVGSLDVTSTPEGASILIEGSDTGETTPHLFSALGPGDYSVGVTLEGYLDAQTDSPLTVAAGETTRVDFQLEEIPAPPARVVLLEEFASVCCVNCPDMAALLHSIFSSGDYADTRVLLVQYTLFWGPLCPDPHYQAATPQNEARLDYYLGDFLGAPAVIFDGLDVIEGSTDDSALRGMIDAHLDGDPGFGIAVTQDIQGANMDVTVTLEAIRAIDRANAVVNVVLVEDPVTYAEAPGTNGLSEFHSIMRDFVTVATAPLNLAAGIPTQYTTAFTLDPGWQTENLQVIAFVQDNGDNSVLQAGTSIDVAKSEAH